jgi:hypothetical protein
MRVAVRCVPKSVMGPSVMEGKSTRSNNTASGDGLVASTSILPDVKLIVQVMPSPDKRVHEVPLFVLKSSDGRASAGAAISPSKMLIKINFFIHIILNIFPKTGKYPKKRIKT